jgi:DNA-binding PadR family transcriptional regulator
VLRIEEGSLYPALHRMEHRRWIRGTWRREAGRRPSKFYRLTRSGRRQLQHEVSSWERMSLAISALVGPRARRPGRSLSGGIPGPEL